VSLAATPTAQPPEDLDRDVRLDIVRGLALWFIVLDHIPNNICDWLTLRHYGFSDTTEALMFVSGITCAKAYCAVRERDGWCAVVSHTLRRSWEIYAAFLLLIMAVTVAAYLIADDRLIDQANVRVVLEQPGPTLTRAMLMQYHPVNSDILPVFVLSHLLFAPLLCVLVKAPTATLSLSALLYVLVQVFGWNLPQWPRNDWYFNPLAWQFLLVLGAWWRLVGNQRFGSFLSTKPILIGAISYLVFGLVIALSWNIEALETALPDVLTSRIYPIDKSDLDPLRLIHFVALAVVVADLSRRWRWNDTTIKKALARCGENSLGVYCLGVLLCLISEAMLLEVSNGFLMQIAVSLTSILLLVAFATLSTSVRIGGERQTRLL
jgi:hypothetical protein